MKVDEENASPEVTKIIEQNKKLKYRIGHLVKNFLQKQDENEKETKLLKSENERLKYRIKILTRSC